VTSRRSSAAVLEDLVVAVPGGAESVDLLLARLEELGLVGWVVDGARLGHDGWVLARVAADDEGALATGDDVWTSVEIDDLRAALAVTWPLVQVGDVVIGGQDVVGPLCRSEAPRLHEVAFATTRGLGLDVEASVEKLTLAAVRMGPKTLFARVQPIDGPEHRLVDVFSTARGGSVVLWRREPHVVLQVLRRGEEVELHVWEPAWAPVGPADHDDVRDALRPPRGDAAEIARVLHLPDDSVAALDALLHGETPPLNQLCDLLGLPDEAARVLSGECAVEELPGAVVHEPTTFRAGLREAMRPSDDDPAWVQWMDDGAREVRPWYVASTAMSAVLGVVLVTRWRTGGSRIWGLFGVVSVLGAVVDLPARWWLKRRRDALT
jgi:hypothetical protein